MKPKEAVLPLILPLTDKVGRIVGSSCRMIFTNAFVIYYSHQHPVAFLSRNKLVRRTGFWGRRRGLRQKHIEVVLQDAARESVSSITDAAPYTVIDAEDNFFALVREELDYYGIAFAGSSAGGSVKGSGKKRRVVL